MLGNSHHINVFLWDGYIYISKVGEMGIGQWALGNGHWAMRIKEVFSRSLT
ncbi:MAG: hypothetical protein KME22_12735 [Hassallia sp. WJT32-NPBG1]|nr:hypothetical protein [Hassallia sp. WJT32-NPBG1]